MAIQNNNDKRKIIVKHCKNEIDNSYNFTINTPSEDVIEYNGDMGFSVYFTINEQEITYSDFITTFGYFDNPQ